MKYYFSVHLSLLVLVLLSTPLDRLLAGQVAEPLVIMISMDGIRHDYLDKADLPGFKRMQQDGLRVRQMYPVFPSNTFPGHVSLATGTYPEQHGIIDNTFYDKKRRKVFDKREAFDWIEAEPLWISVVRQGKRSAVYYWLGSEGQWNDQNATYFKTPFKTVGNELEKIQQIIQWMDMPADKRPQLIMSYWHGADGVGHDHGPEHPAVLKALKAQDKYLQQVIKAIDDRKAWGYTTLILTSDHGMTEAGRNIDLAALLKQGGFSAYYRKSSALAHLNLKKGHNKQDAYGFLKQQKHFDVFYPEAMPAAVSSQHATRSGELVLVAKPGYRFSAAGFFDKFVNKAQGGLHGYSPESNADMRTIFLAMGRGIKKQSRLERVDMIDIAPSVSALLGLEPPLHTHADAQVFLPIQ